MMILQSLFTLLPAFLNGKVSVCSAFTTTATTTSSSVPPQRSTRTKMTTYYRSSLSSSSLPKPLTLSSSSSSSPSSLVLMFGTMNDTDNNNDDISDTDDEIDTVTNEIITDNDDTSEVVCQDLLLSESGTEGHALEVFSKYAAKGLYENQKYVTKPESFYQILKCLDIEATEEDAEIVFRYLNTAGDGRLLFNNEFFPWYMGAYDAASEVADSFQSLIVGRRSIDAFDTTKVDEEVVNRAVQCAIAAPNRSCTEPWRFICIGSKTVTKFAALKTQLSQNDTTQNQSFTKNFNLYDRDWTQVAPGWCVVTTKLRSSSSLSKDENENKNDSVGADVIDDDININNNNNNDDILSTKVDPEDYKSVCCAIQNFMLSMWSEGIGTKWAAGPVQKTQEFADLCGIDLNNECVVGIIWYGYASGGAKYADPRRRRLSVEDVLSHLP